MAPKNRSEEEVQALVGAVKEHKKFKQLACYSIDTITKNISPPNTYWRSALWQARDASAAKHVIDVLKLHRGHEQVVNVSVLCLIRLAVDPQCADDIVRLGGMDVVLESALANPDLPTNRTPPKPKQPASTIPPPNPPHPPTTQP